jgi:hypothetical protein
MDSTAFVRDLFGAASRDTVTLKRPVGATRLILSDAEMTTEGWLQRLCAARTGERGDESLQLVRPTGEAVAFVHSTLAAGFMAAPEVVAEDDEGDLFG